MEMVSPETYADAGVNTDSEDSAMTDIRLLFQKTFRYNSDLVENIPLEDHYAAIIKISDTLGVAIKTDGVGTKTFIAQYMDRYDTIGIDCVAMNVNDIICTGARPTTFVDYMALQHSDPCLIKEIAKGLKEGADRAKVSVVGGETAIMPEMIKGVKEESKGFDLAGAALGIIDPRRVINGLEIHDGDILIGISSSGIHSNGLTLARKVLEIEKNIDKFEDVLGRPLGEELLEPTYIYVDEIMAMITSQVDLKVVAHITSHGLLNLRRIGSNYGYDIDYLPKPQPIYDLIKEKGPVDDSEMYKVFNMGIGMCVVVQKNKKK